jgi:hypothetical protein
VIVSRFLHCFLIQDRTLLGLILRRFLAAHYRNQFVFLPLLNFFGRKCFCGCELLSALTFQPGSSLTQIDVEAFSVCSSLKSICIPACVVVIGQFCFCGCGSLSALTFEEESQLAQIQERALCNCLSLESIGIPASVTMMVEMCFFHCKPLSLVAFEPDSRFTAIDSEFFLVTNYSDQFVFLPLL